MKQESFSDIEYSCRKKKTEGKNFWRSWTILSRGTNGYL